MKKVTVVVVGGSKCFSFFESKENLIEKLELYDSITAHEMDYLTMQYLLYFRKSKIYDVQFVEFVLSGKVIESPEKHIDAAIKIYELQVDAILR